MNEIDESLLQTVRLTWDAVLNAEIEARSESAFPANREEGLVGCIHVTGAAGGVVTLECSHDFAKSAAAVMFDIPLANVQSTDAEDAFGELTNIVGGNFKAMLADGH